LIGRKTRRFSHRNSLLGCLRPDPPDLKDVVKELDAAQIFWVVRNGINMTGMPGFNLIEATDQEIWTIAAFVKQLPNVSDADYATWTAAVTPESPPTKQRRRRPS
jgi:mono/diheme cytochrome c family protein